MSRVARLFRVVLLAAGVAACTPTAPVVAVDPIAAMRKAAAESTDGEVVGRWLLGELIVPGGEAKRAGEARRALDALPAAKGLYASLARAVDDESHGHFRSAALAHIDALRAAKMSDSPDAPLVGWFSANHLLRLRSSLQNLWEQASPVVTPLLDDPGYLGWRARSELVEWWGSDGLAAEPASAATSMSRVDRAAKRHGCVENARLAGPFGHLAPTDHGVRYEAERPGPWPLTFPRDPRRIESPRVLSVERHGCQIAASESVGGGIFYVETFIDLPAEREVIVAVQGAFALFVDDEEVMTRDPAEWGIWPRFGASVRLGPGRHRLLARIGGADTSIRLLSPSGLPLDVATSDDPAPPYSVGVPQILEDPNALSPFMTALGVPPQKGTPRSSRQRTDDPVSRFLAAHLASVEGQEDMSSVLFEPLVRDTKRATGPALATQATFVEKDPIYPPNDARDLARGLRETAIEKDAELWWPQLWLLLEAAEKKGLPEMIPELSSLADHFREVPDIVKGLSRMYGRLGWKPERSAAIKEAAARFPEDVEALTALLDLYDEEGRAAEADAIALRIQELDPDSEVELQRAIARRDYDGAIAELSRLGERRKDRRDIPLRIADLMTRAGKTSDSIDKLERALELDPTDARARLDLADARFARGDKDALRGALVDAIQAGAETDDLRGAIELVEGVTELSPFRQDPRRVIADFEASGQKMPGNAARVLDYSALWVNESGGARMLEHEIIYIQSREAIAELAEQRVPQGLVLRLRTIKKDGRILEPEVVAAKPTVTMPHLEVGDYIETESVMSLREDGQGGRTFQGPRWYFREEKLAYFRSEFIVVSPTNRPLDVETTGEVPPPVVTESGALVTRRWRVDKSPALPEEPGSAPIEEFLPSVRIGWGVSLEDTIARLVDLATDETPKDPRMIRIARTIESAHLAGGAPKSDAPKSIDDRARNIYRWLLDNVEGGRENDPRRVITGKSGNRTAAFVYLCTLTGIDASLGMVRDRLTAPSRGSFSEANTFNSLAVRVATEKGPRWLRVGDKYAPYGYLPSSLRGQPAVVLKEGAPRETTGAEGYEDGVESGGTAVLASDGSARLSIEQRFKGRFAISLRSALETIPDARLKDAIESKLLPSSLPGAKLLELKVKDLADLDAPLTLAMEIEMPSFARVRGSELVISPPFMINIGGLATLPSRETPLYLAEQLSTQSLVRLAVTLPKGATVTSDLSTQVAEDGDRSVAVRDRGEPGQLVFDRSVEVPAGRVQPEAYAAFQAFTRRGDALLSRDIVVTLGPDTK